MTEKWKWSPVEVFVACDLVAYDPPGCFGFRVAYERDRDMGLLGRKPLLKYLRSDLTCGECEKCGTDQCDHTLGHPAMPMLLRPHTMSPACMQFSPSNTRYTAP
jgi:hypothetical protein